MIQPRRLMHIVISLLFFAAAAAACIASVYSIMNKYNSGLAFLLLCTVIGIKPTLLLCSQLRCMDTWRNRNV